MGILALVLGIMGVVVALIPWYAVTQMIGAPTIVPMFSEQPSPIIVSVSVARYPGAIL